MDGSAHRHGGNGVLEDQLFLIVGLKHDGILVERTNASGQLDAAQQIDGDIQPFLAGGVEKRILNVLCRLAVHANLLSSLTARAF